MVKVDDFQLRKDMNGERLQQEFIDETQMDISSADFYQAFQGYLEMKYESDKGYTHTQQQTTGQIIPPHVEVIAGDKAIVITDGYHKIYGVILQKKFFTVECMTITDELLLDLVGDGVISSVQAKELRQQAIDHKPMF